MKIPLARAENVIKKLQVQAGRTGAEIKSFWGRIASLRVSNGQPSEKQNVDILIDLLGPAAYKIRENAGDRCFVLARNSDENLLRFKKTDMSNNCDDDWFDLDFGLCRETIGDIGYLPRVSGTPENRVEDYLRKIALNLQTLSGQRTYQISRFNYEEFAKDSGEYLIKDIDFYPDNEIDIERAKLTSSILYSTLYYYLKVNALKNIPQAGVAFNLRKGRRNQHQGLTNYFEMEAKDIVTFKGRLTFVLDRPVYTADKMLTALSRSIRIDDHQYLQNVLLNKYGLSLFVVDQRGKLLKGNAQAFYVVMYNGKWDGHRVCFGSNQSDFIKVDDLGGFFAV